MATCADVTVVVPARNAERLLDGCLASVVASGPAEVVVVDGCSTDSTVEIARGHGARVVSDGGAGLPAARLLGARAASTPWVALVDADVVLPEGALAALVAEAEAGGYTALQAGLHSVAAQPGDYWAEALAAHHRTGRSKHWFGLVATVFRRDDLLRHGFDPAFTSGEDIEMRWRLRSAGARTGVSTETVVLHRFEPGFEVARGQWRADGAGLARMVRKHGWRAAHLVLLPLAAGLRGAVRSLLRGEPRWLAYYACYTLWNEAAILRELAGGDARPAPEAPSPAAAAGEEAA